MAIGCQWKAPFHINQLELLTIVKVFQAFETFLLGCVVQVAIDNTTAVNKQGGTHSLCLLFQAVDLWEWFFV